MSQARRVSTSPDNRIKCERCERKVISVGYDSGLCPSCELEIRNEKIKELASSFEVSVDELEDRAKEFDLKVIEIDTFESLIND